LVRRLLENGANTSFVLRPARREDPDREGGRRPDDRRRGHRGRPAPAHPPAARPLRTSRRNSQGVDLSIAEARDGLVAAIAHLDAEMLEAGPIVGGRLVKDGAGAAAVSPTILAHKIGQTWSATTAHVDTAFKAAGAAQPAWDARGGEGRAKVLRAMATPWRPSATA